MSMASAVAVCSVSVGVSSVGLSARVSSAGNHVCKQRALARSNTVTAVPHLSCNTCSEFRRLLCPATAAAGRMQAEIDDNSQGNEPDRSSKSTSILCSNCEGNGVILCSQCKGSGINSEDHFGERFKAGTTCWLCRGKRQMLCGDCNGAGFLGGFMSSFEE
ncbi:hypothetical protein O6H91_02G015500 [Diphasiastrum complanatum]|uniref:Uncharacterized protein n=1 Tax=Diphasiastrum complanatum TaxID=34168 RepID=A0ACC2EDD5_DIPCM|nr:hypothetical protein O6H91_Y152100 [Diphasiastrum complanatum]KAJ7564398.1 hypothetical protein O6H91_02G015500 [Diphasiastrum complanatum]